MSENTRFSTSFNNKSKSFSLTSCKVLISVLSTKTTISRAFNLISNSSPPPDHGEGMNLRVRPNKTTDHLAGLRF